MGLQNKVVDAGDPSVSFDAQNLFIELEPASIVFYVQFSTQSKKKAVLSFQNGLRLSYWVFKKN